MSRTRSSRPRLLPGPDAAIDMGFSVILVGLALVGMRTGFLGWQWVLAAAAGVVVGLAVAHVGASLRWPAAVTALALVAVYFLLGGAVAVREDTIAGVIPSVQTLTDLATSAVTGWKRWLTLLPPVDARGSLLALPWLAGLAGAAVTYGVARRWAHPSAAVGAPLALLAASIALGTMQPAATILQGAGFALVLIGWAVVRAHRVRPPVQNGAGRLARLGTGGALLGAAALAGVVAGPALPGADAAAPRAVVRTELTPPYDVSQFGSPLPGFRRYTEPNVADLYDREILRVTGLPKGVPLRFATLDGYDGLVWGAADRTVDGVPFQKVGSRIAQGREGRTSTVTVEVRGEGYSGVWLPLAGTPTGITFSGARAAILADQLWLNTGTETAVVPHRLAAGDRYAVTTILPPPLPTALPAALELADGPGPPVDTSFLDAKIDAWGGNAPTTWGRIAATARYMSGEGAYTDGGTPNSDERIYLPGHGLARVSRFAQSSQLAGNDEQYAATLALVAQRLGVPARVVMGAIPDGSGTIRGRDVHAWVEVQGDNGTWQPLGPSTFLPDRNKKPNQQQMRTEEQRVGAQVPPPAGVNPPSVLQGPDQAQNATDVGKKRRTLLDVGLWPLWLQVLLAVVLLAALIAGLYVLIRWLKHRRRWNHAAVGPGPGRVAWVWRDLVADARAYGIPVQALATRLEQAAALPTPAHSLAGRVDAHVFGPADPTPEHAMACLDQAGEVRGALRAAASPWRRLRADVDLRLFAQRSEGSRPRGRLARVAAVLPRLRRETA